MGKKSAEKHHLAEGVLEFYWSGGKVRWTITGNNGEIIDGSSQGFASVQKCKENLELVTNVLGDYQRKEHMKKLAEKRGQE